MLLCVSPDPTRKTLARITGKLRTNAVLACDEENELDKLITPKTYRSGNCIALQVFCSHVSFGVLRFF